MAEGFYQEIARLKEVGRPFAIATVIAVRGSASARPGSKAIISEDGKNLWGWVGGGCAETFVARNAVEAMAENQTRIVQADLDDEIFGLGMPCGGVMDIFIDPQQPPCTLTIQTSVDTAEATSHLATLLGFIPKIEIEQGSQKRTLAPLEQSLMDLASSIAKLRSTSFDHLRNSKGIAMDPAAARTRIAAALPELLIVGSSRITEELAKFGAILEWPVRVYGWNYDTEFYPESTRFVESVAGFTNFEVVPGSAVVVASHHKGDPDFISKALDAKAAYIGLIASEKRSRLVFESLAKKDGSAKSIFAPAGLDMNCSGPAEIALSCIVEILSFKGKNL